MNYLSNSIKMLPAAFSKLNTAKKVAFAAVLTTALSIADGAFFVSNASGEGASGNVSSGMTSALQTAFGNVQADVTSIITTALPYALAIMGLIIAIRVGVRFFRGTAK